MISTKNIWRFLLHPNNLVIDTISRNLLAQAASGCPWRHHPFYILVAPHAIKVILYISALEEIPLMRVWSSLCLLLLWYITHSHSHSFAWSFKETSTHHNQFLRWRWLSWKTFPNRTRKKTFPILEEITVLMFLSHTMSEHSIKAKYDVIEPHVLQLS